MVWCQCPGYYPTSISAGINLFLGVACAGTDEQFDRLSGRAMSTVDASTPGVSGPGQVGWHLADEADMSVGSASRLPQPKGAGRVTFLTLTDHFSQRAAPPPNGRPTFQWIEAGPMEHCRENQDPAPAIVRAETWLAIAGGARGIGYFPDWWVEDIRNEVRLSNREMMALAPALLAPVAKANWSAESPVRIGARRFNGATYVIAVNTSTSEANAAFTVPGLGGRALRVFRDGRTVKPLGDLVTDKLPGLGVSVHIIPPPGW